MENDTMQFGVHYMLDGYDGDKTKLASETELEKILHELPKKMGMHPIIEPVVLVVGPKNAKDSGGVSGFVMIAESHISFHTFPNRGFISIDVYTCQNELDTKTLTEEFSAFFGLNDWEETIVPRGTRYPASDHLQ